MPHAIRARAYWTLLALAAATLTTGYSSCAGTTGPLLVPLTVTPSEVLLRVSISAGQDAIGLARVDGGDVNNRFEAAISYGKSPPVEWLTVQVSGRDLTLRASPQGLAEGTYVATLTVTEVDTGATATARLELAVIP
jgi:hypothetical protein